MRTARCRPRIFPLTCDRADRLIATPHLAAEPGPGGSPGRPLYQRYDQPRGCVVPITPVRAVGTAWQAGDMTRAGPSALSLVRRIRARQELRLVAALARADRPMAVGSWAPLAVPRLPP